MARGGYRPGSGPRKGTKYRPRGTAATKGKKPYGIPEDVKKEAKADNLDPLTYMLKIMNSPDVKDDARKDRMAIAAAPFCHPRKGEGAGKKDEKDGKAKEAGSGKFKPSKAPLALVK
ncbi:MAG: hypothetical protein ABFD63_04140 [Smithella sp.]